jgi:hypothetical protein
MLKGKNYLGRIMNSRSTKLFPVPPLIFGAPGDFLGIFSGKLRYLDSKPLRAIDGPVLGF